MQIENSARALFPRASFPCAFFLRGQQTACKLCHGTVSFERNFVAERYEERAVARRPDRHFRMILSEQAPETRVSVFGTWLYPLSLARLSHHQERLWDRPFTGERERLELFAPLTVRH